jgi:hypothetical protein
MATAIVCDMGAEILFLFALEPARNAGSGIAGESIDSGAGLVMS